MRSLLFALVCVGVAVIGQGVTVTVTSPPRSVEPGDVALQVFRVENTTDSEQRIGLTVDLPQEWTALPISPQLTLQPGEADTVFVTTELPRGTQAGEYTTSLVVGWDGEQASASAQVTVRQVAALVIEVPQGKDTPPGDTVSYTFVVANRGNSVDRYTVAADSARGYSVTVDPAELPLAPGERGTVTVTVDVPPPASPGRDRLSLVVQSTVAPAVSEQAILFTTVLPPDPERIVGHTLAELETELGGRLVYDLVGGSADSDMALSGRASLLGGDLSFSVRATGPWGDPPLGFGRAQLSYTRDHVRLRAGEHTLSLPYLLDMTASGVLVELFQDYGWLSLFSGWRDEEARFGGTASLIREQWEIGTAYRETREHTDHTRALAGWVTRYLGDYLELDFSTALAFQNGGLGQGFQGALRVEVVPVVLLSLAYHSVDERVPSTLADQRGVSLAGRLAAPPLALRYSSRWVRDAIGGPAHESPARGELSAALDWAPEEWPVSFGMRLSGRRVWLGSGELSEGTQHGELVLTGGEAPLTFRLSATVHLDEDFMNGQSLLRTTYRQRFTFSGDIVQTRLALAQRTAFDTVGNPVERGWAVGLSVDFTGSPYQVMLDWEHEHAGAAVQLGVEAEVATGFSASFSVGSQWDQSGEVGSLRMGVSFEHSFVWAPPFLPARGWLEGQVMADGEPVVGAIVVADGREVATGEQGRFLFPPLEPGKYEVRIDRLPRNVRLLDPEVGEAEVELDRRTHLTFRGERLAEIRGVVFDDQEQTGQRAPDDPGLEGTTVRLLVEQEELERTTADRAGRFSFARLSPGRYTVELVEGSLPERYELTAPGSVDIHLEPGEVAEVAFGAWQRPREVIVDPTPPLADFDWTPWVPEVGEEVTFDGRLSAAGDAEIVDFRWDFTGDGEADRSGRVVTWTFDAADVYRVTLVVEDELGLQDELSMPIEILPAD